MKKLLLSALPLLVAVSAFAQSGLIKGKIVSNSTGNPVSDMEIEITELKVLRFTEGNGDFSFSNVPYGTYKLQIGDGIRASEVVQVTVNTETIELGELRVQVVEDARSSAEQLPSIGLEDIISDSDDDGVSSNSFSPVLSAFRDPFLSAAAYTFGPLRYQLRGYSRGEMDVFINGIPMNDVETGNAFWGQWGGLNDVFRNQANSFALSPMEVGFGGLQGGTSIDATAKNQRQQTRITYSNSNRTYRHRLMVTHSTGLMNNGWAVSASASKRWAQEGFIPGTFYDGYSYFLGLSKKVSSKSFLHFTTFGAPTTRGKASPATQEAMDIAGSNYYNPNWGYLDGEKRNARVSNSFQPAGILSFEYTPNPLEHLNIAAAFQTGYNENSAIDWYNAQDPRPDYYRKLPSFYLYNPAGVDSATADAVLEELSSNPDKMQLDWMRMYEANRFNNTTINGVTGNRSLYVIGNDVDDIQRFSLAANYKRAVSDNVRIFGGLSYQLQMMESYRELLDLLGGDFWVNQNQFAERTYIGNNILNQNNLLNPDEIIREGDKYQYHYKSLFHKGYAWAQAMFTYNKVDFFVTGRVGMESFQRDGQFQSGLFPMDSYGKSDMQNFLTYGAKAGLTYKIDGRNYLYVNGSYVTQAPTFDNTFISPRVRNFTVLNPVVEKAATLEGGYLLHTPYLNGRVSGFTTQFDDRSNILRFYHEDYRTFVNYAMTDISIRNLGAEIALQAKITPSLSATIVGVWTQVFYTNRPTVSIFRDNDTMITPASSTAYLENYYAAQGPQSAYTLGLNYRSPKFWWINVNFNYLDRNYLAINPTRLSDDAVDMLDRSSEQFQSIVNQEKLPAFYTVDIFAGKSFMMNKIFKNIPRSHMLYINVGVNNVTNNKEVITGGFNQLRFDVATRNPDRFPPKYFYGFGANYFLNISYKF